MNDFAERLARGWVRLYTLGLHPEARGCRREEIASDLWEHRADAAKSGATDYAAAVLWRIKAGIPHDVWWSFEARGAPQERFPIGMPWRSQRGLQHVFVWGASVLVVALSLLEYALPVVAIMALGVAGVLLLANLMGAVLGSPSGAMSRTLEGYQMGVDNHRSRRARLLVVLGACVAIVLAMWAYAVSLDHWGDVRTVIFTVGTLVCVAIGLGALVLLVADLLRMRRV